MCESVMWMIVWLNTHNWDMIHLRGTYSEEKERRKRRNKKESEKYKNIKIEI